ncbi:MAG: [acyl-carrier-protein] S-malonyltransferase [Verrucomicrobia bacterium]|nr:MAG: [acyl-carrier-protein] S-malonyltransferase [Verrucomicrobiota bacterium]
MATALMFSGQGAQKVGMGKSLYDNDSSSKELYHRANEVLGWDLSGISFNGPEETLVETRVCQPALFVHGFALLTSLKKQNRLDDVVMAIGLSLGEITALTAAAVFDFETGLRVVAERGRLMQQACEQTVGTMASIIGETREAVQALCDDCNVQIANLNCPGQIVISGEKESVLSAVDAGRERGFRRVIPLNVAGAYHSRLMEPAREAFAGFLVDIPFSEPQMTVLSNTTGAAVSSADTIREALIRQVVSPVLWEDCMRKAAAQGIDTFWELGSGSVLSGLARRTDKSWVTRSFSEAPDLAI